MNASEHLHLERRGPVARVTLNRPDVHNAFDDALIARLGDVAAELAEDDSVRVAILAGAGDSFCAGADLNWMQRMVAYSEVENLADALAMARMFEAWRDLPKPVVGRIHGAALGGGVGLTAVCDLAVASTEAVFGFTEVRLGILPAVISPFVVAKLGPAAAQALFLTGERFDARRAYELGLVQRLVEPAALDAEVEKVADQLVKGGPRAQARIKRLVAEIAGRSPHQVHGLTAGAIARARVSPEGQEGMQAFLERRDPPWKTGK
jgi:methylglutaconyl-CoA hydratase